jgi:hypothetical protein
VESDSSFEQEQADAAASEARTIGGGIQDQAHDEAHRPLAEAGQGESEGFEEAEEELIEHASHGDYQSAHAILHHQGRPEEGGDSEGEQAGDHEHSSEREDDD